TERRSAREWDRSGTARRVGVFTLGDRRPVGAPPSPSGDQLLHPLVVGDERILAEDGPTVVARDRPDEGPVHLVLPPLERGATNEVPPQPRPRRLGRAVPGALDYIVRHELLD